MEFKYKLTFMGHCGIKTLLESNNEIEMANFIFDHGHYKKSVGFDADIDLITEQGELNYSNLDRWVEKYIPEKTQIIIKKQKFEQSFLGRNLVKLGLISPWYVQYFEIIKKKKGV